MTTLKKKKMKAQDVNHVTPPSIRKAFGNMDVVTAQFPLVQVHPCSTYP